MKSKFYKPLIVSNNVFKSFLGFCALISITLTNLNGQTTVTLSGNGNFTVPYYVTSITVRAWGAGGSTGTGAGAFGGGGGAAGASSVITVTPGQIIPYTVAIQPAIGSRGDSTRFGNTLPVLVQAAGGLASSSGTGGAAGLAANSIGTTTVNGLAGANSVPNNGGAGGNSGTISAIFGTGGAGGAANNNDGANGTAPGGGGGGKAGPGNPNPTIGRGAAGRITVTYVDPPIIESQACTCNNNQTPNMQNGTYATTLVIRNSDNTLLPAGLNFTITNTTGLFSTLGGPLFTPSFFYCFGGGCPAGIVNGQYYLPVHVQNSGMYSASVDGPDADATPELVLTGANCTTTARYPTLPIIPFADVNCLMPGINKFASSGSVYNINNVLAPVTLPTGFSQTGTDSLMVNNSLVNESNNNPVNEIYLIKDSLGCRVSSYDEFRLYRARIPVLRDLNIVCLDTLPGDSINLNGMISGSFGVGNFFINGILIPTGQIDVTGPICTMVTFTTIDSCGVSRSDTKQLQVSIKPKPGFNFDNTQVSPVCSAMPVNATLTRTSTGPNPQYTISSNRIGLVGTVTPSASGASLVLPSPAIGGDVRYTICLIETSNASPACGPFPMSTAACADTICKNFVVYRDRSDCGMNALFTTQCDDYAPAYCPTYFVPNLRLKCNLFPILQSPNILSADITLDNNVLNCDDDSLRGSYNVSIFGLDFGNSDNCRTLESIPGVGIICSVLNFDVFGWRPLAALYEALGCPNCLIEVIFKIVGILADCDGGGVIVMADTDGDGGFDYLIKNKFGFPVSGTFSVPNRVKGGGTMAVRAVGAWNCSPADVCGNFDIGENDILEKIPLGLIPVVGPVIEGFLKSLGCKINLAMSIEKTETVKVLNNATPIFASCNPSGFVFAQTLECSIPVSWSTPVAYDGCSEAPLAFRGITTDAIDTNYVGNNPPAVVTINVPGIYQTAGPVPGSILTPGIYPVTYTAVSCNGLPSLCTFNITVTSGNPILECPDDIIVSTDVDLCTARVNGLAPYQGIGCSSIINYRYTSPVTSTLVQTTSTIPGTHNVPDGQAFELGVTAVTYIMQVDVNGDGDYNDTTETQMCTFNITVQDRQAPKAVCLDVTLKLDNLGNGVVYAGNIPGEIYLDGGSSDNCGPITIQISKDGTNFFDSLSYDCSNIGQNVVSLRVTDGSGNVSICKAVVSVSNFFEGFKLDLDVPEVCFEPFQDTFDFSKYIVIARPDGLNIPHAQVGTLGPQVVGGFGISAFLPDPGSTNDPGTMTPDGIYTLGTGTGWITISYILSINGQVNQINPTAPLRGCFIMVHDVFRVEKLYPEWRGGFLCCDQRRILLGHALWDQDQDGIVNGTIKGTLPVGSPAANYLTLDDVLGSYPRTVYGRWTGQGVVFANPDGVAFSGDEYYYFDPSGLDGSYTLTYFVGDEPCLNIYSQEMVVTCQDLQVALSDIEVCPARWVPERVVLIDLNEPNDSIKLVVSVTGLDTLGADGAHIGGFDANEPCDDLVDKDLPTGTQIDPCAPNREVLQVVDGRVVIPGFWAPAVRNKTYPITVTTYQVRNNTTRYDFGCQDQFTYNIIVRDTLAPVIVNCPKEPIVVDALLGQCEAFVNFEYPFATDNCDTILFVRQVDTTGLKSGDLFPVGLTVLAYEITDTVGNQNYCELKIIVSDFRLAPDVVCPPNVATRPNDLNVCGAVVNNIAPVRITDNCINHVAVTYEVTGPSGEQVACGFENASGTLFPIGTSTVKYTVKDQPLILITEVQQRNGFYGVEITNFGPAAVDITCGKFMLKDAAGNVLETFTIPTDNNISTMFQRPIFPPVNPILWNVRTPNNILNVGETYTHVFDGDENGDGNLDVTNNYDRCNVRKYCFGFLDYVMDEAVVNDKLDASVILRNTVCDKDNQLDFRAANPCDTASFGVLNPGLPIMTFRNDTVGLQHIAPSFDVCSFTVSVEDVEAPTCIWHDSIRVAGSTGIALLPNLCLSDTVIMPAGLVDDINIFNLNISTTNAGAIGVYLRGPSGKRIKLFDRICGTDTLFCTGGADSIAGNPNINVNLDETINKWQTAPLINTAPCGPTGQGGTYRPEKSFKEFYGTQGGGNWILEVYGEEGVTGTLNSWDLQILYQIPFGQKDTTIVNSPTLCDTVFSWIHPILEDNCIKGTMVVDYLFSNNVTNVKDSTRVVIANATNTINVMGCRETRRFKVGETIVRYTLTDQYGNLNQCSFKVTVLDTEKPVFAVDECRDRQIFLEPGECVGVIEPLVATDNCAMDTITYCFAKSDGTDSIRADINALPIGDYNIIAKAADIYGNVERCIFRVVVFEFISESIQLACINNVNLSLDGDCNAEVTAEMILADVTMVRCYDNYCIEVLDALGNPRSPIFTKADEGQSFKVVITDCKLPRVPPYNSCWGYIHIERKLGPEMRCPAVDTVFCNVDPNAKNAQGKYILGEPEVTSCEVKTTIWHQDEWTSFGDCEPIRAELRRTWYLENEKGERTSCPQIVRFRRMNLDSIIFPADKLDLVCTNVERNPSLLAPENSGFPSLHGVRVNRTGGLCMVSLLYTDERYEICHGTYEILRTWKVRDMCGPVTSTNPRTHVQVIKVTQKDGPVISDCPADITVTVDAWECLYNGGLPVPKNIDAACSPNYSFSASIFGGGRVFSTINANNLALTARAANLRKGTYRVVYDFKDQCLNKSQCSFNVTVVDSIAPVATAKEFITVSLTKNSANVNETGIAKLFVQQVDNGSYDNCGPIYMEVRRDDNAPACLNLGVANSAGILWNNNRTYNARINGLDQNVPLHLYDNDLDTDKGQYVKFCCEDIGKEVKVWLRVWDDASGDGIFGNSGDNFNETWTNVKVEDKIVPKITCPAEIVTNCDRDTGVVPQFNFVASLTAGSWVTATATNTPVSFLPTAEVVCSGFTFEFKDVGSLNTCNVGKFTRTYRVVGFPSVTCSVTIDVRNEDSDPALEWPIVLHNWDKCTLTEEDVNLNTVRARLNVARELGYEGCYDRMTSGNFIGNRDRCSADGFRDLCNNSTGSASQWNEDPSLPYNVIPNGTSTCNSLSTTGSTRPGPLSTVGNTPSGLPRFNSNYKDPGCNVFGKKLTIEEYTIGDGCRKWLVKWDYINWCCNEQSACRSTIYKYEDTTAPIITTCDGGDKDIVDATCAVSDTLSPTATDIGGCEAGLTWRVRLYPGNKTATGSDFVEIVNTVYSVSSGAQSTSRMVGTNPTLILNNIPAGEHGLRYLVTDGCGNVTECTSILGVWPKAATPYCISISSAVMKNGLVELWANDFDKGSFTNCGQGVMLFTFNRGGVAEHPAPAQLDREHIFTGFGVVEAVLDGPNRSSQAVRDAAWAKYNAGNAQRWLPDVTVRPRPSLPNGTAQPDERIVTGGTSGMQFGCKAGNDISTPIVTEMRVWDYRSFKAGTTQGSDFCSTRLSLIDNQGGCGPLSLISIGGNVATESAKALKNVDVELKSDLPEYPLKTKTDDQGVYLFNNQPKGVEYTLVPTRVDDVFDGINTLDLVHIQRHILGISKLSSPYKMIAADVDFDQAIRVSDIVTLRKLILGIENTLTNDKTWKFVNENDKMEQTPWPFNEQISHALLSETSVANDFVAVKLGDVDGSGSANINSSKLNPRGAALTLDYENIDLKAGQEYEIKLNAPNFVDVYGMQFTLSHKGLEVLDVAGRALDLDNNNFATHKNSEHLTLSWASQNSQTLESDNTLLTIKFISKIDGKLSSVLKLNNDITDTEAYVGNNFVTVPIELAERNATEMKFALSQNEPNPWKELTNINYVLPQSGVVKFKVLDVTGRLILEKQINGLKGNNNLSLSRSEIKGQSGILLYSIEFGGLSFQKKMIILE